MEEIRLTDEQLNAILSRNEGHFFDFKSKRIQPKSLVKTLVAFANADGGEALIGVADPQNAQIWDGFARPEDANGHIQAIDRQFPLGAGIAYSFLHHPQKDGYALRVEVSKHRELLAVSERDVYVRRGARNHKIVTREDMDRLKLNKGITSYEDNLVNVPLEIVTDSQALKSFLEYNAPHADNHGWLKKQLLVSSNGVSVAALVLFADEPQVALPKASIKIYRYKTVESEGTRETLASNPITIEGNAYQQIFDAVKRVRDITRSIPVLGAAGMEIVEFPEVALHEVIANAVLHRDYSIDDSVHLRIFDNRVEVQSPGLLPGHVTTKNILRSRSIRNNKLCRMINKFENPPNKDVGEGLNTAFQAMRELKLKSPEIIQDEATVTVFLRHERLGSAEENIIQHLKQNGEINNSKGRELCAINDANKMKRVFQDMVEGGVIEAVPGRSKRYAAYRKGPNFK